MPDAARFSSSLLLTTNTLLNSPLFTHTSHDEYVRRDYIVNTIKCQPDQSITKIKTEASIAADDVLKV